MKKFEIQQEARTETVRTELVDRIASAVGQDGVEQPIPGLFLARSSEPGRAVHGVSRPSLCVIAQGAKELYLGDRCYPYDTEHYLMATVELPVTGRVVEATKANPYLSVRVELDEAMVGSVMVEAGIPVPHNHSDAKAIVMSRLDADLLDATTRLVRLIEQPEQARVLAPLVKREIIYRLLIGEQGYRLRYLPMLGGNSHSIAKAIEFLRINFDRPLSIEELARDLGMSSSGFHHHFKAITDMTPIQFQKHVRLQEARRLMLGENLDAASAGYRVGYYDASHFSRDYKRYFGSPPARDVERLREQV